MIKILYKNRQGLAPIRGVFGENRCLSPIRNRFSIDSNISCTYGVGFILALFCLSSEAFATQAAMANEQDRWNILFIVVDDMGHADMSCAGHPLIKTTLERKENLKES